MDWGGGQNPKGAHNFGVYRGSCPTTLWVAKFEPEVRVRHCEGAKRLSGGRVWEGGVPPPTVGSFCIFGLEIVQSDAYLDRKFGCIWESVI